MAGLLLLAYMALLIKVMVFKDLPTISIGYLRLNFGGTLGGIPNFIPFKTIFPYLRGDNGPIIGGINILGNILLLVPIGCLLPWVFQKTNWRVLGFIAVLSGLLIELTQVYLKVGIFDLDDVILNALGVLLGYWLYLKAPKILSKLQKNRNIYAVGFLVLAVASYVGMDHYLKNQPKPPILQGPVLEHPATHTGTVAPDPCGGTGGTGVILQCYKNGFSMKRKDGLVQTIRLSEQTKIKNAQGLLMADSLKTGDHVTIVVETDNPDGSMNATLVLVCNGANK